MKLILQFPDGGIAEIEDDGSWQSADPRLAALMNALNDTMGASEHLPHPFLAVAEHAVAEYGATLTVEGEAEEPDDGLIP